MIEKAKSLILGLCEKNKDWDWKGHIERVVKFSKILAEKTNAEKEIIEIAAWLHDIKKVKKQGSDHHLHGAEEAGQILKDWGYPEDKIEKVKHCIITHSSDKNYQPATPEAKVLAAADALANLNEFVNLAYGRFLAGFTIPQAKEWLTEKYIACWEKVNLIPEAKEMAREKYEAVKVILGF